MKVHKEARDLFELKNKDYGDSFANYGTVGVYCINHGYMGGEGLFLYQKPLSDLVFSPSSGVITANRTEQNINSVLTYTGDKQVFIMNVSITDAYNDFTYSENFTMKCS